MAMHLAGLAGIFTDIAYLPAASYYGRLRTAVINTTMLICGSRFSRGWLRPGGVRFGLTLDTQAVLVKALHELKKDLGAINSLVEGSVTVRHRLSGMGVVPPAVARSLGLVGLAARSSGVQVDCRAEAPLRPYDTRPLPSVFETAGDCWARTQARIREIDASIDWILSVLSEGAEWSGLQVDLPPLPAEHMAVTAVEGWRGEVVHVLETGKEGETRGYRIQDPSLRNWMAVAQAVRGEPISDFPICNKSFDLSYCGNDL
jgi:Ni,Fe-hydrogenase III large subunit